MLPLIGTTWLLAAAVREQLLRPVARRLIDITSGLALAGFGARLALQRD
jgi:threonine/homoserine/homoserine lactone efflux protein